MRLPGLVAGSIPVVLLAGGLSTLAAPAAQAAPASTLYVDKSSTSCSNSGTGTQAAPYCTIQAAADAVTPGQTVMIEGGANSTTANYAENVVVRNSGTASDPITFMGAPHGSNPIAGLTPPSGAPFTLDHVHDVTISHLTLVPRQGADGVDVTGSQNVTLDSLLINQQSSSGTPASVSIDGSSSGVTVSRSYLTGGVGYAVRSAPGAQQVTVTTNRILASGASAAGIALSGASGTDVTSNSVLGLCGPDISIGGGSSAVVVENNFIGEATAPSTCTSPGAALSVSADSVSGVHSDYNALIASSTRTEYSWAGTAYLTAAKFAAGTSQGANDFDSTIWPAGGTPPENAQVIDSADCAAPGELSTDMNGNPHVDDPLVAGTGTGSCHADRGAVEREDGVPLTFTTSPSPAQGPVPFDLGVTITSGAASGWNEPVSYSVGFGDGSAPASVPAGGTVSHTYATPGQYTLTVTAADTGGTTTTSARPVVAGTASPPGASLTALPVVITQSSGEAVGPDLANFTVAPVQDEWEVASRSIDFGDGVSQGLGTAHSEAHEYPGPGTYTATLTVTDLLGRTSTNSATVTVGDEYHPLGPNADYSATVGSHKVVKLSLSALHAAFSGADLAELRLMVASPAASGYVTAYPDGTARPAAHSLVFTHGQPASNLVRAKAGTNQRVDFYNGSGKAIKLVVDTEGMDAGVEWGDTYSPAGPARVLSTRTGLGAAKKPVPAHKSLTVTVTGSHGVPAAAAAVLLEVTASGGKSAGHLTVYGHGAADPGTPDVTWAAGKASTGLVAVPVTDGKAVVHNVSGAAVNVTADVVGYDNAGGTGGVLVPVAHTIPGMVIPAKHTLRVQVAGVGGIPASGVTAVAADLTASGATAAGTITAYPDGTANPLTSALSFTSGQAALAQAVIPAGSDGAIELYNSSSRPVTVGLHLTGAYYQYPVIPPASQPARVGA